MATPSEITAEDPPPPPPRISLLLNGGGGGVQILNGMAHCSCHSDSNICFHHNVLYFYIAHIKLTL